MSDPLNYTVGWVCALIPEYVAAQEILDEEHKEPAFLSPNDTNEYTLGRVGGHAVVIAVLPDGEYGTASAATVATNMLNSFPNVRIGLMVGIGGGVPGEKNDIRLGDIVVGTTCASDGTAGIFQYDFGKSIQGQKFQYTRILNQPPTILRSAVAGIRAQYERNGHRLGEAINHILSKKPRLRLKYERPQLHTDRLFKANVIHDTRGCSQACAVNYSGLIQRPMRAEDEDNPAIHYGLIASANQLMKDASIRDKFAAERNILCFDMEAAGLPNSFPCLVIRGICDYSDSHKNKEWQGYAAMVAAAYAKDLLLRVHPNRIVAEKKLLDVLSDLHEVTEDHRNITERQLQLQESKLSKDWSVKLEECLQLFCLVTDTKSATYEWYKDHVGTRVEGTCEWFLTHDNFKTWSTQDSGPLLVSADPGCGKSVLARYLIDDILPRSSTICYFFFKEQDQNTESQALCALLHQLFAQKPSLTEYAMENFKKNGKNLIKSTKCLWNIFENATRDAKAESVIIVLDALDECIESDFEDLMQNAKLQIHGAQSDGRKLKFLFTSRPYEQITNKFRGLIKDFPLIRVPGEEESESIGHEVRKVIEYRVERLASEKGLSVLVKSHLVEKLREVPHRTYLWVYLVFDYLQVEHFKKTTRGVNSMVESLPMNVYEAYEGLLVKSKGHRPMVHRALSIIMAASRPLTLSEMSIALNIDSTSRSFDDLDLEDKDDFKLRLRTCCGLFISVYQDRIHFIHQTAREFLLARTPLPAAVSSEPIWRHSIHSQKAHRILAEICVFYLGLFNAPSAPADTRCEPELRLEMHTFLDYSAKEWGSHYLKAFIRADDNMTPAILSICEPDSMACSAWLKIYWDHLSYMPTKSFTSVMISSHLGLDAIVMTLLKTNAELESKDTRYGRTPLLWAIERGHEAVANMLLEKGANLAVKDTECGQGPLLYAVRNGHESIVSLLLVKDADIEAKDSIYGRTPLLWAVHNRYETITNLLLRKGANFEVQDIKYGHTPLSYAARNGHEIIVKLLLEKSAKLEVRDTLYGQTPLSWAARNGHMIVVKLLLDHGADIEARNHNGRTPLSLAVEYTDNTVAGLLIDNGADLESKDSHSGWTPLLWATKSGNYAMVALLLRNGADFEVKDTLEGWTPLLWATMYSHKTIVDILLDNGANCNTRKLNQAEWRKLPGTTYLDIQKFMNNDSLNIGPWVDRDGRKLEVEAQQNSPAQTFEVNSRAKLQPWEPWR
ncbi:hypothetical protein N7478_009921 [Penicillium angulare]|uniref:uncharacterized protein n=1 Tax=Penicillium angulare TaxID=116970 RepID=UPI00253F6F93|nr:uncharacterized protein N7478_009921 [Penicillium angulare]KAJ5267113.1 hypothetical protein N7478_009921 [Penicillium angulare]